MAADYRLKLLDVATMFGYPDPSTYGMAGVAAGACQLVDDPFGTGRGTVLKVDMYKDQWGYGQSDIVTNPEPMGIQANVYWDDGAGHTDSSFEEVYYSIDMAFPVGFIFPVSIHGWQMKNALAGQESDLPHRRVVGKFRLFTSNIGQVSSDNGGLEPSVTASRVPANGDHVMGNYYYNYDSVQRTKMWTDQPTLAPERADANAIYTQHIPGKWARLESYYKLNTSDSAPNGILESWFNGVKVVDIQDFKWRGIVPGGNDYMSEKFNASIFKNWVGGSGQMFAAAQDQSMYFDNLIVSTSRITG